MAAIEVHAPFGPLRIVSDGHAVTRIDLPGSRASPISLTQPDAVLEQARAELAQYFAGTRTTFTVPIRGAGTPFQQAAWAALREIPYGQTRNYGEQAFALGKPGAARAVGGANRANPIPIIVPCHRVVAADGSLGGYQGRWNAAGGIKEFLLELEQGRAPTARDSELVFA